MFLNFLELGDFIRLRTCYPFVTAAGVDNALLAFLQRLPVPVPLPILRAHCQLENLG